MKEYVEEVIIAIGHVMEFGDASGIRPETKLEDDLGFDSGLYIELIMYLEEQIPGLTIDPTTLRQEDFVTVESTAAFVVKRLENIRTNQ
jgi:acyl carrier protein